MRGKAPILVYQTSRKSRRGGIGEQMVKKQSAAGGMLLRDSPPSPPIVFEGIKKEGFRKVACCGKVPGGK